MGISPLCSLLPVINQLNINTMEKIIKLALSGKYAGIDTEALMEVINATPNAVVATEMLLGLYEKPVIENASNSAKSNHPHHIMPYKLLTVDYFRETVSFSYNYNDVVTRYYKTQEEADAATVDTRGDSSSYEYGEYKFVRTFDRGIKMSTSECSIKDWQKDQFTL